MTDAMMKQWRELKEKHPDALLLFRCGDFYEVYGSDATECARILGITATQDAKRYVMAGFPYHALDTYLPKLVRAGKRVAICDQIQENRNNKNTETMAENVKAADLIGKTIVVGDNTATIVIKSADGDKLTAEFKRGDAPAVTMPLPLSQVEKMMADGVWKIADGAQAAAETKATASEDVEEVTDVKPEKPKAKTVKMGEPKAKTDKPKGKQEKPKAEKPKTETARFTYSTYQNKKGKTCAKIAGFKDDDAVYQKETATALHGSPMGGSLLFGKAYVAFAKQLCDALNEGKSIDELKAMLAAYDTQRAADKAQAKAEREEHKAEKPAGKVYTEQEVVDLVERIIAGDKAAMDELNAMKKAA